MWEDIRGVVYYYMDDDVIGDEPVTTYSNRLKELGIEEETNTRGMYRDFTVNPDIRIAVRSYEITLDQERAVVITAPMSTDIDDTLPDEMFHGLEKQGIGTYLDGNLNTYLAAPKKGWDKGE